MHEAERLIGESVISERPLTGGCIGKSCLITTRNNKKYFYKTYLKRGISVAEASGLEELKKSASLRIPTVIAFDDSSLVTEFIQTGKKNKEFFTDFGRALAKMHLHSHQMFGFERDNFIGDSIQENAWSDNWATFFTKRRIGYQCRIAVNSGYINSNKVSRLEAFIYNELKALNIKPSLLHGDLWSGNYLVDESAQPVLIDPAVYYGHWEAELAMTRLFGGFPDEFYSAYYKLNPPQEGYKIREDFYTLYHLLNHLNLFGTSYLSQVISIITKYV